jgi:hypothetical protein
MKKLETIFFVGLAAMVFPWSANAVTFENLITNTINGQAYRAVYRFTLNDQQLGKV